MKLLVTGCAGFIGYHISNHILKETDSQLIGVDNLNNYYDLKLKKDRLQNLKKNNKFKFIKLDLTNYKNLKK